MARPVTLGMINVLLKRETLAERRQKLIEDVRKAGQSGCQIVLLPEFADHHVTVESNEAHSKPPEVYRSIVGLSYSYRRPKLRVNRRVTRQSV